MWHPCPLLKTAVEFTKLPGECLTEILFVARHLSFPRIREDRNRSLAQLNELRLSAKVYRVLPLSPGEHVQIALQLRSVISCDQNHWSVIGHFDKPVNPEVSFLDCGLVGREVAVDYKEVNARLDGIYDKPFQTLGDVGEVPVFIQVEIASVGHSQKHMTPLSCHASCDLNHNFAVRQ